MPRSPAPRSRQARSGDPANGPVSHPPAWLHADNGFSSVERMRTAHEPIVTLSRSVLRGVKGNVLDLGCGNGALLAAICARRAGVNPWGVDRSPVAIAHARLLDPLRSGNFVQADMFHAVRSLGLQRFELTLFMLGRLLEVPRDTADGFLRQVLAHSGRVVVYAYPGGRWTFAELLSLTGLQAERTCGHAALLVAGRRAAAWRAGSGPRSRPCAGGTCRAS